VFGQGTGQLTVINSVGRYSHRPRLTRPQVITPGAGSPLITLALVPPR